MLHSFEYSEKKFDHKGQVLSVKRGMAWSSPLMGVAVGEIVAFENGSHGRVSAISEKQVEIMILSKVGVEVGMAVVRTGQALHITVGEDLLGHTIDAYGHSFFDQRGNNPDETLESREIERLAPGIGQRAPITKQLLTGVMAVDLGVPLAKGQRELIIGERKTGKSFFAMQTALTQARAGAIVVYGLIGKRDSEIKQIEEYLEKERIKEKAVVVVSDATATPGEIFVTPYTAMTVAEYFADQGKDVVLILDDLTRHAGSYREMSLLGGRFPGRDAYPGDIFYIHARLLERAGSFVTGGTITALPIVETIEGELTGYLQTNLMSMTDGHLYFDNELYQAGKRPAVNLFVSVSRVGRQTQRGLLREISNWVLLTLKKYQEVQRFLRFGSELPTQIAETVRLATAIEQYLQQPQIKEIKIQEEMVRLVQIANGVEVGRVGELAKKYKSDLTFEEWKQICLA